ncbi:MAG: ABC transporter ATP-binding protein [Planctomycetota bacterium]|jgi:ABC-type lipoprotein export system ATPase subunit
MADDPVDQLCLKNVAMRFEGVDGAEGVDVLTDVSLRLTAGDSLAIVGPSGCGKSTLLNIIGTLDRPTAGSVTIDGQDMAELDDADLAHARNQKIGFIFQDHHLLPQCTVLENVLVPTLVDGASSAEAVRRAKRLLERVGLGDRMSHRPGQLSGGQRQRVAVVRALVNEPALLLADEPTGALDRASAENLGQLLRDLNKEENVTLIVVTHSGELAATMGRSAVLRDGVLHEGGDA